MAKKRFTDITQANIAAQGVQALADRPNRKNQYGVSGLSAEALKLWFDNLSKLSAEKINEIHRVLFSEEAAQYIALNYADMGIESLDDFIKKFVEGTAAEEILKVFPSLSATQRISLQSAIYNLSRSLSDLGYGYTGVETNYVDDGGDPDVNLEIVEYEDGKSLKFTFYNFSKFDLREAYVYKGEVYLTPEELIFDYSSADERNYVNGSTSPLGEVLYIHGVRHGYPITINTLDLTGVKHLVLGKGITVADGAFTNNGDLEEVHILDDAIIGRKSTVFDTITSASIYIGDNVDLNSYCFSNRIKGASYFITGKNCTIGYRAVVKISVEHLEIGDQNKSEAYAFYNGAIGNITIGSQCSIGPYSFQSNSSVCNINIGNYCDVGSASFSHGNISAIVIGENVYIGDYAFGNTPRASLSIGKGCTNIGPEAFYDRNSGYGKEYFLLPTELDVDIIGSSAFEGNSIGEIPPLSTEVKVHTLTIKNCRSIGESAFAKIDTAQANVSEINGVTLENGALELSIIIEGSPDIYPYAFYGVNYFNEVIMPDVRKIRNDAFGVDKNTNADAKLNYIKVLDISGCKEIGARAFGYREIQAISWSNSLIKVGEDAFINSILPSIELPDTCTYIGTMAFGLVRFSQKVKIGFFCRNCTVKNNAFAGIGSSSLEGVRINSIENYITNQFETAGSCPICDALYLYNRYGSAQFSRIIINAGVINPYTFQSCYSLTGVYLDSTVLRISATAFQNTQRLAQINCFWNEGSRSGAPWGAPNATIVYIGS